MMESKRRKLFRFSLKRRRHVEGFLFTVPFTLGVVAFFLYSFSQTLIYSFHELKITGSGFAMVPIQWGNYYHALLVDQTFIRTLVESVLRMLGDLPVIVAFSFFTAILLNQKFSGRTIMRIIFFLPVILAAEVVMRIEQADYMTAILETSTNLGFISGGGLESFLKYLQFPPNVQQYVVQIVDRIPDIVRASGIQILIFLAGLQSISPALYEAASVEGSTAWENFWLITLPLMSPLILTNVVYTIVDSFAAPYNQLPRLIRDTAFRGAGFGVSAAMATMYFGVVFLILLITAGLLSRWVFYQES